MAAALLNVMKTLAAATAGYSLPACDHKGGQLSLRDSRHSFGHTVLFLLGLWLGVKGRNLVAEVQYYN
jgi:hypothetical protein